MSQDETATDDTTDFKRMFDMLAHAASKTMTVETQIAQDIGDIRRLLQGPSDRPGDGLLWRVTQIESQLSFFKRWSLVVIVVLAGGQPVIDRLLPGNESGDAALQAIYALLESQVNPGVPTNGLNGFGAPHTPRSIP